MIKTVKAILTMRPTWGVLLVSLAVSGAIAWGLELRNQREMQEQLARLTDQVVARVSDRIELYQYGLRGARGAVVSLGPEGLSRQAFRRYSETRDTDSEFPGARGFGFIRRVPVEREAEFVARAQADGWPDFSVRQLTPHDGERFVIQYIEPVYRNVQAVGLDIASEANRRWAAEESMRTGQVRLTGPITLVQASGEALKSFLIMMPVFASAALPPNEAERRALAYGWSYAPLLMEEVLADADIFQDRVRLTLHDITDETYDEPFFTGKFSGRLIDLVSTDQFTVYGRRWQAQVQASEQFVASLALNSPLAVFAIGGVVSLLLALLVGSISKTRENHRRIRAEEQNLASLVESSADAIISVSPAGTVLSWNRGAELMLGYSKADAVGHDLADLIDQKGLIPSLIEDTLARVDSEPDSVEGQWQTKFGGRVPVEISPSVVRSQSTGPLTLSLTVRDIAKQKQLDASIREINERLERQVAARTVELSQLNRLLGSIMDAATQVAVVASDSEGRVTVFNSGAVNLMGYHDSEAVGKLSLTDLVDPAALAQMQAEVCASEGLDLPPLAALVFGADAGKAEICESQLRRKSGRLLPAQLMLSAIRDGEGGVVGYLLIALDITQQQESQQELQAALSKLSIASEVAHLGVWTWYPGDNALDWNDKMFELYEQPKSLAGNGLHYEHWISRVAEQDRELVVQHLDDALSGRRDFAPEFRLDLPSGRSRVIQAGGMVLRDKSGEVQKITGFNRDITAEVELEQHLRVAKAQSDAASAAKSSFLANMSHEIRTPMNSVLGMLSLLQHNALNTQQRDYVDKAHVAASSLLLLLNDILDFSKIEAGKLALSERDFNLEAMLEEVATILSGNMQNKSFELLFELPFDLPETVRGDDLRIKQVLVNLIGNAIKFTDEGYVSVRVETQRLPDERLAVAMEIEDTGVGMGKDFLARIFGGFEQASHSTSRRYGGSGLGLVISQRLVELMGGTISVTSQLGKGSCFRVALELPGASRPVQAAPDILAGTRALLVAEADLLGDCVAKDLRQTGLEVVRTDAAGVVECLGAAPNNLDIAVVVAGRAFGNEAAKVVASALSKHRLPALLIRSAALGASQLPALAEVATTMALPYTPGQLVARLRESMGSVAKAAAPALSESGSPLAGIRVLVVDDMPVNRVVAEQSLMMEGAEVECAASAEQALALLESAAEFDLVFMDMQMPGTNGVEATRMIRRNPRFANLPIVAMTANVMAEEVQACLDAGMNGHFGKPFQRAELVDTVRRFCLADVI